MAKVSYVIDPADEYPRNFTGHIRAVMQDGTVEEVRQGHMRGGARAPLSDAEVEDKFFENADYGGWSRAKAAALRDGLAGLFGAASMDALTEARA